MCTGITSVESKLKTNAVSIEVLDILPAFPTIHLIVAKPIIRTCVSLILLCKIDANVKLIRAGIANILGVSHKIVIAGVIVEGVPFDYGSLISLCDKCILRISANAEAIIELLPKHRAGKIVNINVFNRDCIYCSRCLPSWTRISEGNCGEQRKHHADSEQARNQCLSHFFILLKFLFSQYKCTMRELLFPHFSVRDSS